jgi:cyclic pyranopterin phosphate synthase
LRLLHAGGRGSVAQVLAGIDAAERSGFHELKINTVVQHFRGSGHTVRLIEFMDVGSSNQWSSEGFYPGKTDT